MTAYLLFAFTLLIIGAPLSVAGIAFERWVIDQAGN